MFHKTTTLSHANNYLGIVLSLVFAAVFIKSFPEIKADTILRGHAPPLRVS